MRFLSLANLVVTATLLTSGLAFGHTSQPTKEDLLEAASKGNVDSIRACLDAGCAVNEGDKTGETALHKAAWFDHAEAVEFLLDHGANVDSRDVYGFTALDAANTERHRAVSDLLKKRGGHAYTQIIQDFYRAIDRGDLKKMDEQLSKGAIVQEPGNQVPEVSSLQQTGSEFSYTLSWANGAVEPVIAAINNVQPEALQFMIDHGANVKDSFLTYPDLGCPVKGGYDVMYSLKRGVNVNVHWQGGVMTDEAYFMDSQGQVLMGRQMFSGASVPSGVGYLRASKVDADIVVLSTLAPVPNSRETYIGYVVKKQAKAPKRDADKFQKMIEILRSAGCPEAPNGL